MSGDGTARRDGREAMTQRGTNPLREAIFKALGKPTPRAFLWSIRAKNPRRALKMDHLLSRLNDLTLSVPFEST